MRLLITGGAGFIGTNLVAYLSNTDDYTITVLDNEILGRQANLENFDVKFVKGDIRDVRVLNDVVPGHDVIVHLAGHACN